VQILSPLLGLFDGGLTNVPEMTMKGVLSTSGRVEITIFSGPTCVILVGELKFAFSADESDLLAQILCEADGTFNLGFRAHNGIAADYLNYKNGLGPAKIYCILAARREYRFFEIDFEQTPYKVVKNDVGTFLTAREGTVEFHIEIAKCTPYTLLESDDSVCGLLLSFLLSAYKSGMEAYLKKSATQQQAGVNPTTRKS
jgi:hypothetical protein